MTSTNSLPQNTSKEQIINCILTGLRLDLERGEQRTAITDSSEWRVFLKLGSFRATADGAWIEVDNGYGWSRVLPQTMRTWLRHEALPEDALDTPEPEPEPPAPVPAGIGGGYSGDEHYGDEITDGARFVLEYATNNIDFTLAELGSQVKLRDIGGLLSAGYILETDERRWGRKVYRITETGRMALEGGAE